MICKSTLICLLLTGVLAACNTDNRKANELTRLHQFNALEAMFESGNWQTTINSDTIYLFFSREAPASFNVYFYQLNQGDSVNTQRSRIAVEKDTIRWNWPGQPLLLMEADSGQASWKTTGDSNGNPGKYLFARSDSLSIRLKTPGEETVLRRTLPISTFLVRSKYDFEHGTQYAFDSSNSK